jgi:hypothetical protein
VPDGVVCETASSAIWKTLVDDVINITINSVWYSSRCDYVYIVAPRIHYVAEHVICYN